MHTCVHIHILPHSEVCIRDTPTSAFSVQHSRLSSATTSVSSMRRIFQVRVHMFFCIVVDDVPPCWIDNISRLSSHSHISHTIWVGITRWPLRQTHTPTHTAHTHTHWHFAAPLCSRELSCFVLLCCRVCSHKFRAYFVLKFMFEFHVEGTEHVQA